MSKILGALRRILPLLPAEARGFLVRFAIASSLLAALDVAALMLLAVSVGSMVQGADVQLPVVGAIGPDGYIGIIGVISLLIVTKSVASVALQWRATRKFAAFELEIGTKLFTAYLHAPWVDRLNRNASQLVRMADVGIANVIAGFLLPLAGLPQLLVTAVSVVVVISVAQPLTALVTIIYLGLIALLVYVVVGSRAVQAGRVNRDASYRVASLMTDMMAALKEVTLRNLSAEVAEVVRGHRRQTTRARANISFLSSFPRFVLDAALVGGFVVVGGVAFATGGAESAIVAIALFGVAGFRLIPSITGFQAVVTQASASIVHVTNVAEDIELAERYRLAEESLGKESLAPSPDALEFVDVTFRYPTRPDPAIEHLDLRVPLGTSVALVGASGAGKSTVVDLLLGLLTPTEGEIRIGEQNLTAVLGDWRARVGYVPQDVALFDGTIAQNVALAFEATVDEAKVERALRRAHLWNDVEARPGGMHARIGDRGIALSGGQRQRLGVARALYNDPIVLVLDEATSALDTKTEALISESIAELQGDVTIVSVAHRLATVREHDLVCFFANGRLEASGSFADVVARVPEFAEQARLAGLA